ncbi:MAG: hypothetical protein JXL80_08270, partial [Planctomycetes bacterium]|nr:hypothetical protein [Planctomycetota bacterium]
MKKTRFLTTAFVCSLALFCGAARGQEAKAPETAAPPAPAEAIKFIDGLQVDADDRVVLEKFIGHAVTFAEGLTEEKVRAKCKEAPEMFAWVEFRYLNCLNVAY